MAVVVVVALAKLVVFFLFLGLLAVVLPAGAEEDHEHCDGDDDHEGCGFVGRDEAEVVLLALL